MRTFCTAFARFPSGILPGYIEEVSVSDPLETIPPTELIKKDVKHLPPDAWLAVLALLAAILVWYGVRQLTPVVKPDDLTHPGPLMMNGHPLNPKSLRPHK